MHSISYGFNIRTMRFYLKDVLSINTHDNNVSFYFGFFMVKCSCPFINKA
jgi:hypothetical protein